MDQANKLGDHLAKTSIVLTHIFASPLTRTSKTAEAIRKAQATAYPDTSSTALEIVKVPELIEQVHDILMHGEVHTDRSQDFGYYEGKSFQARSADSKKSGRETHREQHKDDPFFVDVESKESMAKRADQFLDEHLLPLLDSDSAAEEYTVAVVSHGILLPNLWRRLLLRLPRRSLMIGPEVTAARGDIVLEHLGGWSNTGYLYLSIQRDGLTAGGQAESTPKSEPSTNITNTVLESSALDLPTNGDTTGSPMIETKASEVKPGVALSVSVPKILYGYSTKVLTVDNKQHLVGLKRQRGGIGRSAHDESQKKLDGFFKKQRIEK